MTIKKTTLRKMAIGSGIFIGLGIVILIMVSLLTSISTLVSSVPTFLLAWYIMNNLIGDSDEEN